MEKQFLLAKRHSIRFTWLISYIMILLIPVIFGAVIFKVANNIIEEEVNKTNMAMLKQVQTNMDNILNDARRLSSDIALNSKVQQLMTTNSYPDTDSQNIVTELYKEFKRYDATNGYIDDFYVFFRNSDFILSPLTAAKTKHMYDILGYNGEMSYDQWHLLLSTKHIREYLPLSLKYTDIGQMRTIAYFDTLPMTRPDDVLATIVIIFNESRFQEMIQNIQGVNEGEVYILDQNNNLLASAKSPSLPQELVHEKFGSMSGSFTRKISEENATVSYICSDTSYLKYVSVIPKRIFMQKSVYFWNVVIVYFILCLLIGGIAAYILTKRNYNPVHKLLKTLYNSDKTPNNGQTHFNEYKIINDKIHNILDERDNINRRFEQQRSIFRSSYLQKLLKGTLGENIPIHEGLSSLNISFISDQFAVMLIYIEDLGSFSSPDNQENSDKAFETVKFIISNIMEELTNQQHRGFMIDMDEVMACLVNLKNDGTLDIKQELVSIAKKVQEVVLEYYSIQFTISISTVHQTICGIPAAYEEALEALEYKLVMGCGKIIYSGDINSNESSYFYPLEAEQQLINYIKSGDFSNVEVIINRIFRHNFSEGLTSIQMAKCLTFDLVSTIIKTMDDVYGGSNNLFLQQVNPIDQLLECKTIIEMRELMLNILGNVCDDIKAKKVGKTTQLSKLFIEYIKNNYFDMNLGISAVAMQFDMTPTYVSKVFKEQTGEGMLDYINKFRLGKAKELLKNDKASIVDTATKVGYSNSNALIRAFKKYEGTTPGQYKGESADF